MARRKTLKKQRFVAAPNCFQREESKQGAWRQYLGSDAPLILELGCGKAELSMGLARKYPGNRYLGIDLKMDRMSRPGKKALEEGLSNIAFICIHLLELEEHVQEGEVDEIWITFPDPFPKKRQAKHRMINPSFLALYQKVLKPGGVVRYKTDNLDLFHYSLELFVRQGNIHLQELSFDLHADENFPEDVKIRTSYEKQFMEMGMKINYVSFTFEPAS